jgi:hypothetical protein
MTDPQLISVRTEVVLDVLVTSIHEEAARRAEAAGGTDAEALGYHARVVEWESFEPSRAPIPWLQEILGNRDAHAVAGELADAEPQERPDPASAVASWRIPGPGGHVRHYVARLSGDKTAWMRGYFLRCCEEVRAGGA